MIIKPDSNNCAQGIYMFMNCTFEMKSQNCEQKLSKSWVKAVSKSWVKAE